MSPLAMLAPLLAQEEAQSNTGASVIDWLIVVVLVAGAVFVVCRSSRRN